MVNRDSLRSTALAHNINLWRDRFVSQVQQQVGGSSDGAAAAEEGALGAMRMDAKPDDAVRRLDGAAGCVGVGAQAL